MTPNLAKALLGFQKEAPPVHLDAVNPHFKNKYASLAGVVVAVRPVLNKHGLIFTQSPTNLDGAPALRTTVTHAESGEEITDVAPLILTKLDSQGYGSALTYARRYALLSILGLVGDDDDDANTASGNTPAGRPVASQGVGDGTGGDTQGLAQARGDAVEPGQVIVPFGKHKGSQVKDVPRNYWEWWLAQDGNKNPEVLAAVEFHLGLTAEPPSDLDSLPF